MILFDKRKVTATLRLTHLPDRAIRGTTGFEASEWAERIARACRAWLDWRLKR